MRKSRTLAESGTSTDILEIPEVFNPFEGQIQVTDEPYIPPDRIKPPPVESRLEPIIQVMPPAAQEGEGPHPLPPHVAEIPTVAALAALKACAHPEWQNPHHYGSSQLGDSAELKGYTAEGHAIVRVGIKRPTCHEWHTIIIPKVLRFEELC